VLVDGLDHPEGVAWDPAARVVYAGGEAGQIYRISPDSPRLEQVAQAPGFVLGLAVDGVGRVVACVSGDEPSVCLVVGSSVKKIVTEVAGEPLIFPNYPAFASDGTLFFTDSGVWGEHTGRVIRLDVDGTQTVFSRALDRFPNGCAVTSDGRWLWVVESLGPTVSRFDLRDGSGPELLLTLHGHVPDGLALTLNGCLISCYRPDRIYHLDVDGRLEVVAQDPHGTLLAAPTNVCFVGERMDRAVSANLGRWHLTILDLECIGSPLHYPNRWAADRLENSVSN